MKAIIKNAIEKEIGKLKVKDVVIQKLSGVMIVKLAGGEYTAPFEIDIGGQVLSWAPFGKHGKAEVIKL